MKILSYQKEKALFLDMLQDKSMSFLALLLKYTD